MGSSHLPRAALLFTAALFVAGRVASAGAAEPRIGPDDADRLARLSSVDGSEHRFVVVEEAASKRFVQFASGKRAIELDVPVRQAMQKGFTGLTRDADCSSKAIGAREGEVQRGLPFGAEERLVRLLEARKLHWRRIYCARYGVDGARVGHGVSIQADLPRASQAPSLVEAIFSEVFGVASIGKLRIETDG